MQDPEVIKKKVADLLTCDYNKKDNRNRAICLKKHLLMNSNIPKGSNFSWLYGDKFIDIMKDENNERKSYNLSLNDLNINNNKLNINNLDDNSLINLGIKINKNNKNNNMTFCFTDDDIEKVINYFENEKTTINDLYNFKNLTDRLKISQDTINKKGTNSKIKEKHENTIKDIENKMKARKKKIEEKNANLQNNIYVLTELKGKRIPINTEPAAQAAAEEEGKTPNAQAGAEEAAPAPAVAAPPAVGGRRTRKRKGRKGRKSKKQRKGRKGRKKARKTKRKNSRKTKSRRRRRR